LSRPSRRRRQPAQPSGRLAPAAGRARLFVRGHGREAGAQARFPAQSYPMIALSVGEGRITAASLSAAG
jgi:hypothetical protein